MNAKMERQKTRNDVVKLARDEGKLDLADRKTKELIESCMASEDPIKAMQDAIAPQEKAFGVAVENSQETPEGHLVNVRTADHDHAVLMPGTIICVTDALPLSEASAMGYRAEHVQLRLTNTQKENLSQLFHGLREQHVQMENGHHVDSHVDAVRWLLEQIPQLQRVRREEAAA